MSDVRGVLKLMVGIVGCLVTSQVAVAQQFDDLLKTVPPNANAMIVIDAAALKLSGLAKKEHWADRHEEAFAGRALFVPPEADRVVIAAQLNVAKDLEAEWELAVMQLGEELPLKSVARGQRGYVDTISGAEAAWTPNGAYFVEFAPRVLGVISPDNRQTVARWIEFGRQSRAAATSPYLREAASQAGKNGQILMALDLSEAVQPHRLDERLQTLDVFEGKKVDLDTIAGAIASLRGVTLAVRVGEEATAKGRIDFAREVAVLKPYAKQLVLAALDNAGASLDDAEKWKFDAAGKSVTFEGALSDSSLRRIFSLLEIPSADLAGGPESSGTSQSKDPTLAATQQYYKSLTALLDDLRVTFKDHKQNQSIWLEKYARKIDQLPILNVDDELLAFGGDVSERLRKISVAKRTANVRTGVRQQSTYGNYYNYGGNYDYGYYTTPESQRIQIRTSEQAVATKVRTEEAQDIGNLLNDMRQKLTKKYQVEF